MDRYLDGARSGPTHLRQPGVAAIVVESIQTGARLRHYELGPWVVMLNHVHLLIRPQIDASRLLQSLKGGSARRASQLLGLTGQRFWQEESYDHVVHDEKTFRRIANYIEDNPVRAGLCETPAEFAWSSAAVSAGADD
jgi:putative DNA methylase